jgi:uncharacterized coiled-coil DUF342 family protein
MEAPEELSRRLSAILEEIRQRRSQRTQLLREILQLHGRRKELIKERRGIREQISSIRSQYKELGDRLGDLRSQIEALKKELQEKRDVITKLAQKLKAKEAQVSLPLEEVERRLQEIEWRVQTSPTNVEVEKRLMEEWKRLEGERLSYEEIKSLRKNLLDAIAQRNSLKLSLASSRESLGKLLESRRGLREAMEASWAEDRRLRSEIEGLQRQFLERREAIDRLDQEILALSSEVEGIRGRLAEIERKAKERRMKEVAEEVRERMNKGGKITLQELQILLEVQEGEEGEKKP